MRRLKKQFEGRGEVKGYVFTQLKRNKYCAIYEKKSESGLITYEVFKIKTSNFEPDKETYPTSKAFGIYAWECTKLTEAEFRYEKLSEYEEQKELKKKQS